MSTAPLNIDELMRDAQAKTAMLEDFGDDHFIAAATTLFNGFNRPGLLTPQGIGMWRKRSIDMLKNRLVIEDYFARIPDIAQEEIEAPIVIVGLPRTGTTLLQRVLSCDTRFYPMLAWEARFPAPFSDYSPDTPDPRIEVAVAMTNAMIKANPDLLAIHPLNALEADEEGILLEHTFMSFFDSYADIPEYTDWMWNSDQVPAYRYLKRMLQFIQWQKRQRGESATRWVLKTPHHLRQMKALFAVFPDASIIQTHRDPLQTIPSIASFTFNMWKLGMQSPDPTRAGRQWSHIWARGIRETMEIRDQLEPRRFHDVWFKDTLTQPLEVVKDIYRFLGLSFPEATQEKMTGYLEHNRREKRPLHEYSVEHYGLTENSINKDFAGYRARFID